MPARTRIRHDVEHVRITNPDGGDGDNGFGTPREFKTCIKYKVCFPKL